MTFLQNLTSAIKSGKKTQAYRNPELVELAQRMDQLIDFVATEAKAYADTKTVSSSTQSAASEDLDRKTLMSVEEAKAYTNASLEQFSRSLGGMGFAIAELSNRVDQFTTNCDHSSKGVAATLGSLKARLGQVKAAENSSSKPGCATLISEVEQSIEEVQSNLLGLDRLLSKLDHQITQIETSERSLQTDINGRHE